MKNSSKKTSSKVPDYLREYLDEQEIDDIEEELYKALPDKEFWKLYKYEIVRSHGPVPEGKTSRNAENVENERELTDAERGALIALCEHDLYLFAIRYFPHYLKLPSSPLHTYLYKFLSDNIVSGRKEGFKHAIAAPRGNAKSTIVSNIAPLWCICYNKKHFIVTVSDTLGQAQDFLADVRRELESNEKLAQDFPHVVGKGEVWRADEIITRNNVKVRALGTGSKVRGRKYGTYRPDLFLMDDLESSEMVRSEVQRTYIRNDWLAKDLLYAGETSGVTDFFAVGTILGPHSLLNALLNPEEFPEWSSKKFAAVLEFAEREDLWKEWESIFKNRFDESRRVTALNFFKTNEAEMLRGARVLWSEGDDYYSLMVWRASDPSGFISEKQNSPLDPSKLVLPKEILRVVDFSKDLDIQQILNNRRTKYYGALDPSLGKRGSDFSCITILARDPISGLLLVVEMDLQRRSPDKQIEDIFHFHSIYNFTLFGIEINAFQVLLADSMKKKSRAEGIYLRIKEIRNYSDKRMRIESLIPLAADGTLIFDLNKIRTDNRYALGWEQITTYSGDASGGHDDAPDCLEMVVRICTKPRFRMLTKQNL